jgi:hypothetical protein
VPAAPEAKPHGQAGAKKGLDRCVGRAADEREGLHQQQIGRLVLERAREQPDRLESLGGVDVAIQAERDGAVVRPAAFLRGLAGELHPATGDVHPVQRFGRPADEPPAVPYRGREPPGVGGEQVAAGIDVAAVNLLDLGGLLDDRADPPQVLLGLRPLAGDVDQLRADCAVEHHAAVAGNQIGDPHVPPLCAP